MPNKTPRWDRTKKYMRWASWKSNFKSYLLDTSGAKRNKSHEIYQRFYFRGHGRPEWGLEPTFDRRNRLRKEKRNDIAAELVQRFIEQAQRFESIEYQEGDVRPIAVAQHHGLPTRLLDWSASPYIAAFFAFEDRVRNEDFTGNIAIWALDTLRSDTNTIVTDDCTFHRLNDHVNARMGNQQGAFTMLHSDERDLRDFLQRHRAAEQLTQFLMPAHQAVEALDDLILMGVHHATLFPDRGGAASHVDLLSRMSELRRRFVGDDGRVLVDRLKQGG